MRQPRLVRRNRERGVAIVTALLLTTLAVTIVASLFWQQQVQVRSIENQRLQLQKQWILRGALDWTRLILREDGRYSRVDHLGEPWAVPLAETRLDQYVDESRNTGDVPDAALAGAIIDAQSRFNLRNLCSNGTINPVEVATFARLLTITKLNPDLALQTANLMQQAQQPQEVPQANNPNPTPTPPTTTQNRPLNLLEVDDLLAVPGFTPEALDKIRDFVVVLPRPTPLNVNTVSAEVLAARFESLTPADAAAIVASRERAWFRDIADFNQRLQSLGKPAGASGSLAVSTSYFLVNGDVRLNRATLNMQALIERSALSTRVLWIREG